MGKTSDGKVRASPAALSRLFFVLLSVSIVIYFLFLRIYGLVLWHSHPSLSHRHVCISCLGDLRKKRDRYAVAHVLTHLAAARADRLEMTPKSLR